MKIFNYNISFTKTSNFPAYKTGVVTRAGAKKNNAMFSPTNTIPIALNLLKKASGIDPNFPSLLKITSKSVQINSKATEIWAVRLSVVFALYATLKQTGLA